jgi:predicted RNA-binding Zn-ribbon protein involved in translation (DUF1610 family)
MSNSHPSRENGTDPTTCPACRRAEKKRCKDCRAEHNAVASQYDDYPCPTCGVVRAMGKGRECVPCRSDRYEVADDGTTTRVEVSD